MGHKTRTRKVRAQVARRTKKAKYRVKNWRAYNASLVERGSLTVWISAEALANWRPALTGRRMRGGQTQYSSEAIECLLTIGAVLGLPLRQTEGFGRSVLGLLRADVKVPDYTTLCRRGKTLEVKLPVSRGEGPLDMVVDSTGLKVYGEGEWKVRQYGYAKRRIWRKLHLSVNAQTQQIEIAALTEVTGDDAGTGSQMLGDLPDPIERVTGDGDYDKRKFYQACVERHVSHIHIPPQHNARIWQHGNSANPPLPRDQNLRRIHRIGRARWKIETGYHRRSLVETAVFRFKSTFGTHLTSRSLASQQVEARLKCRALNIMAHLGLPDSYPVTS